MKGFLAILALVFCVFAEEWIPKNEEQVKSIHIECTKLHSLTPEQFVQVRKLELSNDEPIRRYFRCVAEKIGTFDTDHGYYADRLAKQFKKDKPEEEVKKWAEDCIANHYNDAEEDDKGALNVRNCFMQTLAGEEIKKEAKEHLEASQRNNKTLSY